MGPQQQLATALCISGRQCAGVLVWDRDREMDLRWWRARPSITWERLKIPQTVGNVHGASSQDHKLAMAVATRVSCPMAPETLLGNSLVIDLTSYSPSGTSEGLVTTLSSDFSPSAPPHILVPC